MLSKDLNEVVLALGSNLGDRCANLLQAELELSKKISMVKTSSVYETPPWGYTDQPVFLNQVLCGSTKLEPHELLVFVKVIENEMGRVKNFQNGPRLIDIDILLFGDQIVNTENLMIPHPRMLERGFVLLPLSEIEPDLLIPGTNKCVNEFLISVDLSGIHKYEPKKAN